MVDENSSIDIPRRNRDTKEPSLIPMVNVVLLLLVFFMVAGSIEKFDILPLELPLAKNGKRLSQGQLMIMLGAKKEIVINEEFIKLEDFVKIIAANVKDDPKKIISLKADSQLPASFMIMIMNKIREAGGTNISLITTPF